MATQTRNPTSDVAVTGTWTGTASSRYTLVDDHPDSAASDKLTCSAAGTLVLGFSAFSIPANSTSISVQVLYYDAKNGSQSSACGGLIRCNDTTNRLASTHNPANATFTARSDNWATNPKSSASWTVSDVNGSGTNALTAFGLSVTDASPTVDLASIQLQVTYTPPSFTGTSGGTVEAVTGSASGTSAAPTGVEGTSSATLTALTGSASGQANPPVSGTSAGTDSAVTGSASGKNGFNGTSTGTLAAITGSASGKLAYSGTSAGTLTAITESASGQFIPLVTGISAGNLAALTATGSGKNGFNATSAGTLSASTGTGAGKLGYSGTSAGNLSAITGNGNAVTGDGVLGTSAGRLQAVSGSASGFLSYSGTSAATLVAVSQTASGTHTIKGSVSGTLSPLIAASSGLVIAPPDGPDLPDGPSGPEAIAGDCSGILAAIFGAASGRLGSLVTPGRILHSDSAGGSTFDVNRVRSSHTNSVMTHVVTGDYD